MKQQTKAYLFGLAAVMAWSTVASAFKISLKYLDPIQLLFFANVTSVAVLATVLAVQKKIGLIFKYTRRQYLRALLLGLLSPLLYYLVLFKAYDLLPAQEAQSLNYTWAITMTLLSIPLLGQKIGARDIIAGIICYAGVFIISTRGQPWSFSPSDPLGVGLALLSTVIWAIYWIYNTRDKSDPTVGLFMCFVMGLPFTALATGAFSSFYIEHYQGILGAVYVGIFEMGITFVFWLNAMKLSSNTAKVSNLIFISPLFSLIFINIFVGEKIHGYTLIGLAFILIGLALQNFLVVSNRQKQ